VRGGRPHHRSAGVRTEQGRGDISSYAGKIVKAAVTPTVLPFTYADPKDLWKMTGVEVELIERVLTCAGLKFEFVVGPWSGNLAGLFADVMVGDVNYTADRAKRADYVIFMRNGSSVVVQKGNPKNIHDIDGVCGARSATGMASTSLTETRRLSEICVEKGKTHPSAYSPQDAKSPPTKCSRTIALIL